jgi:cyclic-di-GMP-binding protein
MVKSIFGLFQTANQDANQDESLANVQSVGRWAANLPANDPMGGVMAMVHLLEERAKQPAVTADRILAVLELDRLSLPLQVHLQVQYRSPTLSDEVRQQLWYARNDLARWLAYAYEQLYEGIRSQPKDPKIRGQLHGIFSRMFHYRGVQAKQGLFRYEQWIPARWKFLHAAYKEASELGIATLPFSLMENSQPGDRFSTEQEYVQFLLLQRINTGNLSVPQIELASQWLRDWVPSLKLSTTPLESGQHWVLDLGSAGGLLAPRAEQPVGALLYLDITPLRSQLTALMTSMTEQLAPDGARAGGREIKERLALAKRLELLWLPNARLQPRRGERRADQRAILVAPGWTGIAILMREAHPWKPHDPYSYTYDDAAQLATLGRAHVQKKDSSYIKEHLHPDRRGWEVLDTSESGCRIQSATRDAAQLQIGGLLGLLWEGDSRWRIGIVRRLKRRTADHTELGIEIIAENTLLITAEPVTPSDSGYSVSGLDVTVKAESFDALYLPPQQRAQLAPVRSLVVPAAEFAPGRVLTLRVEGQPSQIRLAVTIEQTRDWVWTTFEVMGNAQ